LAEAHPDDRLHPVRPILAASVAIFRDGRVLLAARGREPMKGVFTLPGGAVELGETLSEAALREVREETGLTVRLVGFVTHQEVIHLGREGRAERHFVICVFAAHWQSGEPAITEEASEFRWADPVTLDGLRVTEGLASVVAAAKIVADR
jgi:ADP-ribose pyrophosphatase YjhB (NUDIX family)